MRLLFSLLMLLILSAPVLADVETLRTEATAAMAAGDIDVAMSKMQRLLENAPEDGPTHYYLGTLLMDNNGSLDESISHFVQADKQGFRTQGVAYRLSRIYARTNRSSEALAQLGALVEGGFGSLSLIEGEADYESIKEHPRFVAALEAIRVARFPCQADERHFEFDFWVGEWNVTQNGQFAGTNIIQSLLGHCLVFEQWTSASGSKGKSFNYYDPSADHWRQIWISDTGTIVEFTGEARDGGIYYVADTTNPADGAVTHHKFEFTRNGDGSVRQFWATSTDDRQTWSTIWDGRYDRQTDAQD